MSSNPGARDDFNQLMENELASFVTASREFGLPLLALADKVKHAFECERAFIENGLMTVYAQRGRLANQLEDLSRSLREIQEYRDRNRHVQEFFNHLAAVAESVVALSWVTLERNPAQFIRDMKEAGDYFGNRVLSANRGNSQHLNWWNKWTAVIAALENYVRTYHLTGFSYVAEGGGPVPPPPPPPPAAAAREYDHRAMGDGMRQALINQINQGVGIVGMLRPVAPRVAPGEAQAGAVVRPPQEAPPNSWAVHPTARAPLPVRPPPPPVFILDGRRWRVENQRNSSDLVLLVNEMSESLAMYNCDRADLDVQNKINGATIDGCKRSTVVFRDVISTVELIRCQRMVIQCIGHVPSINLDSCDSVQIYLTNNSLDAEIITSKTTSLNVCLLAHDGDYTELPVPEQIRTTVVDGSLRSNVVQQI